MALRNEPGISEFGKRLFSLIDEMDANTEKEEDRIRTPKGLAKRLYHSGLVTVKTKDNDNAPSTDTNNAIGAVEKKIVNHINTGKIIDQKGEFVIAYSKFFHCSADYILGLTDIRTPDVEVRRICELTGLSEVAVTRLVESKSKKEEQLEYTGCWSLLMSSDLYFSVPTDWMTLADEWRISILEETEYLVERAKEKHAVSRRQLENAQLNMEGARDRMKSRRAAFYGMLAKISRNIADYIENDTKASFMPFQEGWMTKRMEEEFSKYKQFEEKT